MSGSSMHHIFTGVGLDVNVETTGYDGGDSSITTLSIRPHPGFQHHAEIFSLQRMYSERDGSIKSDEAISFCFQAKGDQELDGLRLLLKAATNALDEILGELPEGIGEVKHV